MQETLEIRLYPWVWGGPLEEGVATHSSVLAWEILWREKPGRLQPMGSQRVSHDWSDLAHTHTHTLFWIDLAGNLCSLCFKRRTQPAKTPHYSEISQRKPGIQLAPALPVCPPSLSLIQLYDPMGVAHQAPLSMGFPRQEYWSRLPFLPPREGMIPTQGSNSRLLCLLNWQILYHWASWNLQ